MISQSNNHEYAEGTPDITPRFKRAVVIGCSGAGKSTFASQLGAITGIPVVHIDQLFWQPGWKQVATTEYNRRLKEVMARDQWIIEGINVSTLGLRLQRADVMFWLTHGRMACIRRVLWRVGTCYGRVRPDMAPGCPERYDGEFMRWVWRFHAKYPPLIEGVIAQYGFQKRVIRMGSDRESQSQLRRIGIEWPHDDVHDNKARAL